MRYLPDFFYSGAAGLTAIEERKLAHFYSQYVVRRFIEYGTGHFVLACYAALPAVLTPDLLYKLWQNFNACRLRGRDAVIHAIAPADLMLSDLLEPVGPELWQMPDPLRKALLGYVQAECAQENLSGFFPLADIATFLLEYVHTDAVLHPNDASFRQAQEWTALSYLQPGYALSKVRDAWKQAANDHEKIRYQDAIEKMTGRFALEIVQNKHQLISEIPAFSALTSITRGLLTQQLPQDVAELRDIAGHREWLTLVPSDQPDIISIPVQTEVVELADALIPRTEQRKSKTYILLVEGASYAPNDDLTLVGSASVPGDHPVPAAANVAYMADALQSCFDRSTTVWEILEGERSSKWEIERVLKHWSEVCTPNDDVVMYISGFGYSLNGERSCIALKDSLPLARKAALDTWMVDENLAYFAQGLRRRRFILMAEAQFAGTPSWLPAEPGNIVLASCNDRQATLATDQDNGSMFTRSLRDILWAFGGKMPLRQLFVSVWEYFESQSGNLLFELRRRQTPSIFAHPSDLVRHFARYSQRVELQTALRRGGWYSGPSNDQWDRPTAQALAAYCVETGSSPATPKSVLIQELNAAAEQQLQQQLPVFLLIFGQVYSSVPPNDTDQTVILDLLAPYDGHNIEVRVLEQPDRAILHKTLADTALRHRIQLMYYSGTESPDGLELSDGVFQAYTLARLLDFQENMHLLIANAGQTAPWTTHLSQLGVRQALGAAGTLDPEYLHSFGPEAFRRLMADGHIGQLPLSPNDNLA